MCNFTEGNIKIKFKKLCNRNKWYNKCNHNDADTPYSYTIVEVVEHKTLVDLMLISIQNGGIHYTLRIGR